MTTNRGNIQFIDDIESTAWHVLRQQYTNAIIITDENIQPLYGDTLATAYDAQVITIPAGEKYKNRQTKAFIEDELCKRQFRRNDLLIAVGGGVITDLVGFVAATYQRGVDHINIPTTLLAMVDAAIGGKTAINTPYSKNGIGAFHSAKHIIIWPPVLRSLTPEGMLDGLIETIKHGLIADEELFSNCEQYGAEILNHSYKNIQELIQTSMQIKRTIVEQDPLDRGLRQCLNLGHTVGHSIEYASDYSISHGIAVAIGIIVETQIAVQLNLLNANTQQRIAACLYPLCKPQLDASLLNSDELLAHMQKDKKNISDSIQCVMLKTIGQCHIKQHRYTTGVSHELMESTLQSVLESGKMPC